MKSTATTLKFILEIVLVNWSALKLLSSKSAASSLKYSNLKLRGKINSADGLCSKTKWA